MYETIEYKDTCDKQKIITKQIHELQAYVSCIDVQQGELLVNVNCVLAIQGERGNHPREVQHIIWQVMQMCVMSSNSPLGRRVLLDNGSTVFVGGRWSLSLINMLFIMLFMVLIFL